MPTARPETLEPEFLAQLGSIYDEAWASVAASYTHVDTHALADARAELAAIMMRLAADELASGELKDQAIHEFRRAMAPSATQPAAPCDRAVSGSARPGVNVPAN
jgi:hypothetical protein